MKNLITILFIGMISLGSMAQEKIAKIEHRKGYSGGGTMSFYLFLLLAVALVSKLTRTKNNGFLFLRR